jgi:hypothetical protein
MMSTIRAPDHRYTVQTDTEQGRAIAARLARAGIEVEAVEADHFRDGRPCRGAPLPTGAIGTRTLLERGNIELPSGLTLHASALRCYDKLAMLDFVNRETGIAIPETWTDQASIARYPVFHKPAREGGGGPRGIAAHPSRLPSPQHDLLYQELIDHPHTFGVAFVAREGCMLATVQHREILSTPLTGGSAVALETFRDDRLERVSAELVEKLRYSGWGLMEFKFCTRRQDYVFMELNAKFWASIEFSFRNEPALSKHLFGIETTERRCRRAVFVDRYLALPPAGWRRGFGMLSGSTFIREKPIRHLIVAHLWSRPNSAFRSLFRRSAPSG